jgi:hypothetical protein
MRRLHAPVYPNLPTVGLVNQPGLLRFSADWRGYNEKSTVVVFYFWGAEGGFYLAAAEGVLNFGPVSCHQARRIESTG